MNNHTYHGSCHCGKVRFTLVNDGPITTGMRCNCSMCRRRNAVMSSGYYSPEQITIQVDGDALGLYQFEPKQVNHYFCRTCGIYPFHDGVANAGTYRVNLGCVDGINLETLTLRLFDGADTWKYLD